MGASQPAADWIEALQGGGRYTFVFEEAEAGTGASAIALRSALRRLRHKGRIASPRRGFFVIVPPEYRSAGCPPATWFVDDLMAYLELEYYVGVLTAAALHGSGHQQPMVFQIIADRPTRPMNAGRGRIEVHSSRNISEMPVSRAQTETGTMALATPETTAYDLVRFPGAAGHWSNVATVLAELAERLDPHQLLDLAPRVRLPDVQRLGYLLTSVGQAELAEPLAAWLAQRRTTVVRLNTSRPAGRRKTDPSWRLVPNEVLDLDL